MSEDRPRLEIYFLRLAGMVATRSTWIGTHVGCVVVQGKQIVSTGYNGTPRGFCNDLDKTFKKYFCHAEENAIVQAARHGVRLQGAEFYCTISPCLPCARMMVNVGAEAVIYAEEWDDAEGKDALALLRASGIVVGRQDVHPERAGG